MGGLPTIVQLRATPLTLLRLPFAASFLVFNGYNALLLLYLF